jgi:hypothetical protein
MIAVLPQEHGLTGDFLAARLVEIDDHGDVAAGLGRQGLVERDGQVADERGAGTGAVSWCHREIGQEVDRDQGSRLPSESAEDDVQVVLVLGDRDSAGDVIWPDRERDEIRTLRDRAIELIGDDVGRGGATRAFGYLVRSLAWSRLT